MSKTRKPLPPTSRDPDQLGRLVSRGEMSQYLKLVLERERAANDARYLRRPHPLRAVGRGIAVVLGFLAIFWYWITGRVAEAQRRLAEYREGPVGPA